MPNRSAVSLDRGESFFELFGEDYFIFEEYESYTGFGGSRSGFVASPSNYFTL